jgi:hypothetical protein
LTVVSWWGVCSGLLLLLLLLLLLQPLLEHALLQDVSAQSSSCAGRHVLWGYRAAAAQAASCVAAGGCLLLSSLPSGSSSSLRLHGSQQRLQHICWEVSSSGSSSHCSGGQPTQHEGLLLLCWHLWAEGCTAAGLQVGCHC